MLKIIRIMKPFPKKIKIEKSENINCFFDYKKYVRIDKLCENLLNLNDEVLYEALSIFSKKRPKYKDTLYYNLETLTISKKEFKNISGTYLLSKDKNELTYSSLEAAYHELIHIATSQIDKIRNILYSAFSYFDGNSNKIVGEGITEGYIELLCDRDLHNGKFIHKIDMEKGLYIVDYCYAKVLARQLEIIVGEEQLEDMCHKNGFIRLKEFLMQYKDEESVNKFFKNCDIAAEAENYRNYFLNKKVLEAQEFLLEIVEQYMPEKKESLKKEMLFYTGKLKMYLTNEVMREEARELKTQVKTK